MSIKKTLKLLVSIMVLMTFCAGLVIYENNYIASIGAHSADILLPTYNVGTEYNGLITQQYVTVGSPVHTGQKLFEIKSSQLTTDLANGTLTSSNLNYQLASDGGFVVTAERNGVISQINALEGSFVTSGSSLATITSTKGASVRADFDLSGPQYAKVSPETPVMVGIGGSEYQATISGITQQSVSGHTYTIVTASMPTLSKSQTIYANGTPAQAKLIVNTNTIYDRLVADVHSQKLIKI